MEIYMLKIQNYCLTVVLFVFSGCFRDNQKISGNQRVGIQPDGSILVPSNQLLRPAGFQVYLPGRPVDLALIPDGKYLYVANRTENAICVIQTGTAATVLGSIPTGWYPGSVVLNSTGEILYIANVKGIGSLNQMTNRDGYNSLDPMGSVSIIPLPGKNELGKMRKTVNLNNSKAGDQKVADRPYPVLKK